jgi:hypothetical protein
VDEHQVRDIVKAWHQRAMREGDLTSRFVFLWFCFNACLAFESEEDFDAEMIRWLAGPSSLGSRLRLSFETAQPSRVFRRNLHTLADMSPVVSTGRRRRIVQISSSDDFHGIVRGIYQVRCNLFHGGKRPHDRRDDKLVRVCARILEKWIGNL